MSGPQKARRTQHFPDPRLEHQIDELVRAINAAVDALKQIGVDIDLRISQHAADTSLHITRDYRDAMDKSLVHPSATNPFVTEESLNDAMTGAAKPGVQTLEDLAAIPPDQRADKDTRLVEDEGKIYRFDADADHGDVKPLEGPGWWIAVAAATQNHNNLSNLQGGSATERYHLTKAERDSLVAHLTDTNNPHQVTPEQIGAETPAGAQAKVDAHASRTDNPHRVTAAQVGAYPAGSKVVDSERLNGQPASYYAKASDLNAHMDATSGVHGATSSATANRIIIRDSAGRAKVAAPSASDDIARKAEVDAVSSALNTHKSSGDHDGRYYTKSQLSTSGGGGQVHWNNVTSKPSIPSNPVPVSQLKKAQGTMSGSSVGNVFAVHQYAFASPLRGSRTSGNPLPVGIILGAQDYDQSSTRQWVGIRAGASETRWGSGLDLRADSPSVSVTWDYLTASGHPRVWVALDDLGEIVAIWEAEDPADPEWPDEPPFEPEEGLVLIQVEPPDEKLLGAVAERLERAPMPQGFTRSIYAADQPPRALRAMFARQLQERGLEEPPDIRDVLSIADRDRRYWYLQLYMRQASRLLHDHRASTLIPLYRDMCRVDRRTGRLVLR